MPEMSDEQWAELTTRLDRIEAGQRPLTQAQAAETLRRGYAASSTPDPDSDPEDER